MKNYRFIRPSMAQCIGIIAILLSLLGCHKKLLMEKITTPHIAFGSGGGFTGMVKQYHLLEDGQIVEEVKLRDSIQYNVVANIGKRKAKDCFEAMKKMQLDSMQFNEPSNHYYFISVPTKDTLVHNRIVWGSKDKPITPEVQIFYKTLQGYLIKTKE